MSLLENWYEEMRSAYLYQVMVQIEADQIKGALFLALAEAARDQAKIWQQNIECQGQKIPEQFIPGLRVKMVAQLLRRFGPRPMLPVLAAMKVRGLSIYKQGQGIGVTGHVMPTSVADIGHRHQGVDRVGNFRAAIFGINDGLVSNACLILGVAGATQQPSTLILTGVAGLVAGAFSMAAGEYVSVRSQCEFYQHQISLERQELELYPDEEAEELALIYQARGLSLSQARKIATDMMQDQEHALNILAREELGLNPDELGSPLGAALASFGAFACGALVPLLPLLGGAGNQMVWQSAAATGIALFLVGALISLFTGRHALTSGLRMVLIGGAAGAVTYFIGKILGVGLV